MDTWSSILDASVAGRDDAKHLEALRLPTLDGWEPGRVWATTTIAPDLLTPVVGSLFGGHIAALADHLLANAVFTVLEDSEAFATAELQVHFFRPVRDGPLQIEARVVTRGRRSAYCEASFHAGGRLVARAGATQSIWTVGERGSPGARGPGGAATARRG